MSINGWIIFLNKRRKCIVCLYISNFLVDFLKKFIIIPIETNCIL